MATMDHFVAGGAYGAVSVAGTSDNTSSADFSIAGSPLGNAGNILDSRPGAHGTFGIAVPPVTNVVWQGISSSATYCAASDVLAKA